MPEQSPIDYLDNLKKELGYIEVKYGNNKEEMDILSIIVPSYANFFNVVEVGKTKDGLWCAQFCYKAVGDSELVEKLYFTKKPNREMFETARLLEKVNTDTNLGKLRDFIYKCWRCGTEYHWLEIQGTLQYKYEARDIGLCPHCTQHERLDSEVGMSYQEIKVWMEKNLVRSAEAHLITEQSRNGFNQSITNGYIKPFYKVSKTMNLYLRSDLEEYAKTKRVR